MDAVICERELGSQRAQLFVAGAFHQITAALDPEISEHAVARAHCLDLLCRLFGEKILVLKSPAANNSQLRAVHVNLTEFIEPLWGQNTIIIYL